VLVTRPSDDQLSHPRTVRAFRTIQRLVGSYLALGVATVVAVVLMRDDAAEVNPAVWTRTVIVVATAVLLLAITARAAQGSRGAYRRLRIVSVVATLAIVAIVALPGPFPLWLKLDQAVCGLIMAGIAVVTNGRHLRELFAAPARAE
jgi:hypothetical protein